MNRQRLPLADVFGLRPVKKALSDAALTFRGDPNLPASRFGASSLAIFTPRLAVTTWLGRAAAGRSVVVANLFNRTPTPVADGWSVRVTQVRDYRGGRLTYDSHNGTDFVVPTGTATVAAAAARVVSIRREFNRGGLKVYLDHGGGLMTTHNHLARALVRVGDRVRRGQPVALTGYSGLDGVAAFPWVAPHVHYNVILGGRNVDPYAASGEVSLWRVANDPRPAPPCAPDDAFTPTRHDPDRVAALLADLLDDARRARFAAIADVDLRAAELTVEATVYPTRFATPEAASMLFEAPPERAPCLDLPFSIVDFDDTAFADDLGFRRS
ncbi:MAG: hypothetical protein CSA66_05120 [Proteobacteria bacterium]|nr:MAG: hypothetical protein CSA66_05120 [Pseudomonadota bacterium]